VLIAAMLILPATAARFWTDRLGKLLAISAALGAGAAALGTLISAEVDGLPTGPTIVLVGAAAFLFSALFAARRGAISRLLAQRRFQRRLEEQRLLRNLFEAIESNLPERPIMPHGDPSERGPRSAAALHRLASAGWISIEQSGYRLTEAGLERAARVVRGYRLWRLFLHEYADQIGSFGELDVEAVDERLPADLVLSLESRLAAEGQLPQAAEA